MLVGSISVTFPATVVPAEPVALASAAKVIEAASPTLTEPMSDSDTEAGMTIFVRSESVMNPLLVLMVRAVTVLADALEFELELVLEFDELLVFELDVELVPVEEPPVLVEPVELVLLAVATDPDPGAVPTTPFTEMTVAAIGDVSVQVPTTSWAVVSAVWAVVTAVACWVSLASAWLNAVWALATCWLSLSSVLASEFWA